MIALDIVGFDGVNSTFGWAAGDAVLTTLAARLTGLVGGRGIVARTDGGRFVVVLEPPVSSIGVQAAAREILDTLRIPIESGDASIAIDGALGFALGRESSWMRLLENAQTAQMTARQHHSDQPVFYQRSFREETVVGFQRAQYLRAAMDNDELALVYQPIHRTDELRISGVEALLRWDSAALGPIPPVDFIPIAEETGMLVEIGAWVLAQAMQDHRQLAGRRADFVVSVNVSCVQIEQGSFVDVVESALDLAGVGPESLQLEITESIYAAPDRLAAALSRLQRLGVGLALDDVAMGCTSLGELATLPIDTIKLDRSLLSQIGLNASSSAQRVVADLSSLGRSLGLDVVAEGVETPAQARAARDLGCSHQQGYLYAVPASVDAAAAYCRSVTVDR